MFDYDWREYRENPLPQRYPQAPWVYGLPEWRWGAERLQSAEFALVEFYRELSDWPGRIREAERPAEADRCPRVFVSHRQVDEDAALRVAWLAAQENFDYWLDITDLGLWSLLLPNSIWKEILLAAIIEMALLNCTHVIAVMTSNTAGSQWVPYEYGRRKPRRPVTNEVSCWWDHTSLGLTSLPGYVFLAPVHGNEAEIRKWLYDERRKYQKCPGNRNRWKGAEPAELPTG